jgi:hypothetical protein
MGTIIVNASLNQQVNFNIGGTITNIDFGDGSPIIASSADTSIVYTYSASGIYTITFNATSLDSVYFSNNFNIESVDVSSTPNLIALVVENQPYLTSIDVSNSTITELSIRNCYSFDTLDITNSNDLTFIGIQRTKLSSIDLTSKTQLVGLTVTSSKLTSINTSPCSLLDRLDLFNNELSGITFGTHNNIVKGTNLSMNKLTSIDLSGLPNVRNIDLGLNQLTSLNVSSNTSLRILRLGGNNINATNLTSILVSLDGFGLSGGTLYISNQNPLTTPTPVGLAAISRLQSKGWSIDYENKNTDLFVKTIPWECDSLVNTFGFNVDQVYENGTIYNFSGYSDFFTCGQVVGSDSYGYGEKIYTPLVGPYETCNECNNYDIISLERCNSEREIYQFSLSSFTGTPLVGDTYYINFATPTGGLTPPLNILGCFSVNGFGNIKEGDSLSVLISGTSETSCTTCLEGNSKTYLVYNCNNFDLTHYISLPDDSLIGHLITFNDIATGLEQFCGIVDSEQIGSVDISLVNDLGLYTEELCTQCLSTVAEKREIVDCLDSENVQVVWNSLFFESGDVSNLSTNDGCFTVSGLTEDDVTVQTFLDFDPQPDCQDCIQCNGVTYTATSLDEECLGGGRESIFASYQYLEIGQVISLNDSCVQITSVSPGISDFNPYYSFKTFATCEECKSTTMERWEAIDCVTNRSFTVNMVSGSSINDIVHIKWGETDLVCVTLSNLTDGIASFYSDGITHNDCPTCSSTIELGLTLIGCTTGIESYVKVTSEVWQNIVGYSIPFTVGYPVISDANGNCYYVKNSCPITVQEGAQSFTPQNYYFNCPQCAFDNQSDNQRMARSANTEYNACVICCDCGSTATTVNSVTTPHPVYTDGFGTPVTQLNMVVLGGINGLNS